MLSLWTKAIKVYPLLSGQCFVDWISLGPSPSFFKKLKLRVAKSLDEADMLIISSTLGPEQRDSLEKYLKEHETPPKTLLFEEEGKPESVFLHLGPDRVAKRPENEQELANVVTDFCRDMRKGLLIDTEHAELS